MFALRATAFGDDWTGQPGGNRGETNRVIVAARFTVSFLKNAMARLVRLLVHYDAISFSNNEACAKGLQHADAEDLAQEVLAIVGRAIESFDAQEGGSFRAWLFTITRNLCVNHLTRCRGPIGTGDSDVQRMLLESPDDDATLSLFDLEHRRLCFQRAADQLRPRISESTWLSFWLTAVDGQSIESVAQQLGKSNGAVRVARCRVLAQLKEQVDRESY